MIEMVTLDLHTRYTVSKKSFPPFIYTYAINTRTTGGEGLGVAWLGLALLLLNWGRFCNGPWL